MGGRNTVELLAGWGEWSRIGCGSLRAKSQWLDVMVQGNSHSDPDITDSEALRVDRVVAQLGLRNKFWADVLKLYFIQVRSMRELEIHFKLSKFTMAKEFAGACGWVDCALFGIVEQKDAA